MGPSSGGSSPMAIVRIRRTTGCSKCNMEFRFTLRKEHLFQCEYCGNEFLLRRSGKLFSAYFLSVSALALIFYILVWPGCVLMKINGYYRAPFFLISGYGAYKINVYLYSKIDIS